MSTFPTKRCAVLLIILFSKLGTDGVYSMEAPQTGDMGPDPIQTPLDKLEEQVIGDLQTEVDNLEKEERSFYSLKNRYQELRGAGQCTNKNKMCHAWSCAGECDKNPAYMLRQCTWSCGACGPKFCLDNNKNCDAWMKRGECSKNPGYMLANCCWSCMACGEGLGNGSCKDLDNRCPNWAQNGECEKNPKYMLANCRKSCNVCKGTCKDLNTRCAYWACVGECQKNPRYMLIKCRESCNVCHKDGNNKQVLEGENCPEPQPKTPQPTCDEKVDIMVLMDGSASVGRRNFPDVRNFVLSLAAGFRIGAGAAQLGVYQYAIRVQKEIGLNQFNNREDLLDGIKQITFLNGMGTLTGRALTQVHQDFTTANGARAGVQKVIILITDGQASDIVHLPSENIRKQGVLISAVGVANYNLQQLNDIASGGKFVATVEQFDAMDSIRDKVLDAVCQAQQKRGQDMKQEINNGLQYLKRMLGALEDELEQETKK